MDRKAIIICQAGHEVTNVLSLYEKINNKYNDIIIVSNRTDSYKKFFELFNLNARYDVWTSNHFSSGKPQKWKSLLKEFKNEVDRLHTDNADVFYTCVCDLNLVIRLRYFSQKARFFYHPGKELALIDRIGLQEKRILKRFRAYIIKFVSEIVCGRKLLFKNHGAGFTLAFSPEEYGHSYFGKLENDKEIERKYKFVPQCKGDNLVIFFTEPYRNKFHTQGDYDRMNKDIVRLLQDKGYKVLMKGHPRIGEYMPIASMVDESIPAYVPSEFIDYTIFKFAIGFVSTSLCNASVYIPTFSVLDMCNITDTKMANDWHEYLDKNSSGKVSYLKTLNI